MATDVQKSQKVEISDFHFKQKKVDGKNGVVTLRTFLKISNTKGSISWHHTFGQIVSPICVQSVFGHFIQYASPNNWNLFHIGQLDFRGLAVEVLNMTNAPKRPIKALTP